MNYFKQLLVTLVPNFAQERSRMTTVNWSLKEAWVSSKETCNQHEEEDRQAEGLEAADASSSFAGKMRTSLKAKKILLAMIAVCAMFLVYTMFYVEDFNEKPSTRLRKLVNSLKTIQMTPSSPEPGARAQRHLTHEEVGQRFQQRLRMLREACKVYANFDLFRPISERVYVKHVGPFKPVMNFSLEYCSIPKTGSTTWDSVFTNIALNGERLTKSKAQFGFLKTRKRVVFVFVREPYSRLLSAYVDKLFSPNTLFWTQIGKYIIRNFRKNASEISLRCGHDVTFPEFVRYVIHAQRTGEHREGHFVPTHDHCNPCGVPYQYVGHLETLREDMAYLLNVSQAPYTYTTNFNNSTLLSNAGWVLKSMRRRVSKCMSLQEACRRLWKKWQIRGIISKREPAPALSDKEAAAISKEDFVKLAQAALARSGPKESRKQQKTEALREAFASVPLEDRNKVEQMLFLDFALFGFPSHPDVVFPLEPLHPPSGAGGDFSYFNLGPDHQADVQDQNTISKTPASSDDVNDYS